MQIGVQVVILDKKAQSDSQRFVLSISEVWKEGSGGVRGTWRPAVRAPPFAANGLKKQFEWAKIERGKIGLRNICEWSEFP